MAQITLKPASSWESYESGLYIAEIAKVEVVEHAADNYHEEPYDQLKWSWRLHIEDRDDHPWFSYWTSLSLNSKSKLPKLLDAFGIPHEKDGFDPSDAIGHFGKLYITEYQKADKTVGNKVADYTPYKGKALKSALTEGSGTQQGRIQGAAPKRANDLDEGSIPF